MNRPRNVTLDVEMFPARTPTLPPATHTNSYALGAREVLLVEPATPHEEERAAWVAWARGIVSQGRRVVAILATHHHPDHIGGAAFLSKELGLPVWAHPRTIARLSEPGAPAGAEGMTFARELADGDTIDLDGPTPQRWRVLHTPGHAPGHVCLFDEATGVFVAGDMVASEGTILIEPRDGDMAVYLAQLDRLAGLGAKVALPAHGEPIVEPTRLFRHYVAHRLAREAKVIAALSAASGASPTEAILAVVYADTPAFLWPLATLSLEAHLIKLEREGRAVRDSQGWSASSDAR
jgi:glyoxylase-like metal-dependent hydrolase (beta-lactamase superfamily II)